MKTTNVLVVGAGAQAKYIIEIFKHYTNKEVIGIADVENNSNIHGKQIDGVKVLGNFDEALSTIEKNTKIIIGYSNNKKKQELAKKVKERGFSFINAIHPESSISENVNLGKGVIVNANATVLPFAKIGNHVMIHSNTVVEHDNIIGDYVNLAPGVSISGYVKIGERSYIYTGASISPNITVGKDSTVGAGAVVIENVIDNKTVVGVPAKPI